MMDFVMKDSRPKDRFLSRDECAALAARAATFAVGGGESTIFLESEWSGNLRWARNQISSGGDIRRNDINVRRLIRGADGRVNINQIDDASLNAAVRRAERMVSLTDERPDYVFDRYSPETYLAPKIWSDETYALSAKNRADTMRALVQPAETANMSTAGYIQVAARGRAVMDTQGRALYYPYTHAQYSVTVRDPGGIGSGWAGVDWYDWAKIDAPKISAVALDKCLRSRNPVAVEPGRYTAILEPQAVCDLVAPLVDRCLERRTAESREGPFAKASGLSKINDLVADRRVTLSADPMDPQLGLPPFDRFGNAYAPATWIENGVLKNLAYDRGYAITKLGSNIGLLNSHAFRLNGENTTIDEMIATTKRGLLVTRLSGITIIDFNSVLCSGFTRDGLWLIENGKIAKAVKNFRITESPMFVFNNIQMMGVPTRCFRPKAPAVCPAIKVSDFSFSSLTDAV